MAYVVRRANVTTADVYDSISKDSLGALSVNGRYSPARMASAARQQFGATAAIENLEVHTKYYRMPLDVFICNADEFDPTED